ncbi:MAG: hypothetical protein NUV98_01915, partial [Candidatus Roizmanbacteria bacterium]|nr:hypothetical protein [Candidatus Roizmanbacteria bacterium]
TPPERTFRFPNPFARRSSAAPAAPSTAELAPETIVSSPEQTEPAPVETQTQQQRQKRFELFRQNVEELTVSDDIKQQLLDQYQTDMQLAAQETETPSPASQARTESSPSDPSMRDYEFAVPIATPPERRTKETLLSPDARRELQADSVTQDLYKEIFVKKQKEGTWLHGRGLTIPIVAGLASSIGRKAVESGVDQWLGEAAGEFAGDAAGPFGAAAGVLASSLIRRNLGNETTFGLWARYSHTEGNRDNIGKALLSAPKKLLRLMGRGAERKFLMESMRLRGFKGKREVRELAKFVNESGDVILPATLDPDKTYQYLSEGTWYINAVRSLDELGAHLYPKEKERVDALLPKIFKARNEIWDRLSPEEKMHIESSMKRDFTRMEKHNYRFLVSGAAGFAAVKGAAFAGLATKVGEFAMDIMERSNLGEKWDTFWEAHQNAQAANAQIGEAEQQYEEAVKPMQEQIQKAQQGIEEARESIVGTQETAAEAAGAVRNEEGLQILEDIGSATQEKLDDIGDTVSRPFKEMSAIIKERVDLWQENAGESSVLEVAQTAEESAAREQIEAVKAELDQQLQQELQKLEAKYAEKQNEIMSPEDQQKIADLMRRLKEIFTGKAEVHTPLNPMQEMQKE